MHTTFKIDNLHVRVDQKLILSGATICAQAGEIHALMGPNGSGKSTLAYTLMGHPQYHVIQGDVYLGASRLNDLTPDKRAKLGIFLAFQYPLEIEGIDFFAFLRQAYNALYAGTEKQMGIRAFRDFVAVQMKVLNLTDEILSRGLNVGLSGGERKRVELLQLFVLQPHVVILDEIDSGLDIDSLRLISNGIIHFKKEHPHVIILIITHYQRILNYLRPNYVHIMESGAIVRSGDEQLAFEIEQNGYEVTPSSRPSE